MENLELLYELLDNVVYDSIDTIVVKSYSYLNELMEKSDPLEWLNECPESINYMNEAFQYLNRSITYDFIKHIRYAQWLQLKDYYKSVEKRLINYVKLFLNIQEQYKEEK